MKKVVQLTHSEDDFFKHSKMSFMNSKGQPLIRDVVIVCDLTNYVTRIHDNLGLDFSETLLKIGMDSGRGSFKVCLTVVEKKKVESERDSATEFNSVKHLYILCIGNGPFCTYITIFFLSLFSLNTFFYF